MNDQLSMYIPIMKFMAKMLGPDVELVLYDVSSMSVLWVESAFDEEMIQGSEMRSLERNIVIKKKYKGKDFEINYRTLSKEKHYKMRSGTMFIKNDKGELQGLFTMNFNVNRLVEARDLLESLVNGPMQHAINTNKMFFENLEDNSLEDHMKNTIAEEINAFNIPAERLTYHEKMLLMTRLEKKAILAMKGSVAEIARQLKTTETSIYRYISKLNEN